MHQLSNSCDGYRINRQVTFLTFRQQEFISYYILIANSTQVVVKSEKFSTGCFGSAAQGAENNKAPLATVNCSLSFPKRARRHLDEWSW